MILEIWLPLVLIVLSTIFLVVSGIKRQPGIGIILTVILIGIAIWQRETSLAAMGFSVPENWLSTIMWGLLIGSALSLFSIIFVEPLVERWTGVPHDIQVVESVRGNLKALLTWLVVVWVLVAFLEETLYRGFLMTEIIKIIGDGNLAIVFNILLTSVIFGLSHSYQGKSGAWSTGIFGALIAVVFVWDDFNIWLPIFVHGCIDTVALVLISRGLDERLKNLIWKSA